MSIFRPVQLGCPACGTAVNFDAVHSVNADRRPDLRLAILDNTFQEQPCPKCGKPFRLDPEFNLLDVQRGQWIAAAPLAELIRWKAMEDKAKELFERSYGEEAADIAQEVGKTLRPRVTFGWLGLREKLLAAEHDLDDVVLELCKAFIVRNADTPLSSDSEMRLLAVSPEAFTFGWQASADGAGGGTVQVGRAMYDEIAADESGDWDDLRDELTSGYFVDMNRMLIASAAAPAPQP